MAPASAELFRGSNLSQSIVAVCRTGQRDVGRAWARCFVAEEGLFGKDTGRWHVDRAAAALVRPALRRSHQPPRTAGGGRLAPQHGRDAAERFAARATGSADHPDERHSVRNAGPRAAIRSSDLAAGARAGGRRSSRSSVAARTRALEEANRHLRDADGRARPRRGDPSSGPEDRGDRPVDRRRRSRLQQSADGHLRRTGHARPADGSGAADASVGRHACRRRSAVPA